MMKNEDVFDVSVMLVSKEVVDVAIPLITSPLFIMWEWFPWCPIHYDYDTTKFTISVSEKIDLSTSCRLNQKLGIPHI